MDELEIDQLHHNINLLLNPSHCNATRKPNEKGKHMFIKTHNGKFTLELLWVDSSFQHNEDLWMKHSDLVLTNRKKSLARSPSTIPNKNVVKIHNHEEDDTTVTIPCR